MNSQSTNTNAVSPVLAVILMIGVTVILSTAIGVFVLDLGQATTTQEPSKLGVTITEHESGTVSINTKTGSTDSLRVLVNGEERVNQSVTPGDSIEVPGVPEDARISIIDSSGSSDKLVLSQVVSNGIKLVSEPSTSEPSDISTVSFANGNGTEENPYVIMNDHQLQAMNNDLNAHYVLGRNIDASGTREWNTDDGFAPIGTNSNKFTGSLDGNGYVIDGLYINRPNTNYVGLLGGSEGSVTNIGVVNADVSGDYSVGGLVGLNRGTVTSSYSTGSVTGTGAHFGGLVGYNNGDVTSSYSTGSVSSESGNNVGGLVGYNTGGGTLTSSYSTGSVDGTGGVGGLVGGNGGTVEDSYSTGSVTGNNQVGGLVGLNGGPVEDSYSTGSVTGTGDTVGGLVGKNNNGGTVTSSYSTGSVSGDDYVGGLIGYNYYGTVTSSYSTGSVSGDDYVGGLVGNNYDGSVKLSYWSDTSNTDDATGEVDNNDYSGVETIPVSKGTGSGAVTELGFDSGVWNDGSTGKYPELAWKSE